MDTTDDIGGVTEDASGDLGCGSFEVLRDADLVGPAAILRIIVDDLPDAVIVHRLDGEILFFNQAACRLLGYSRDEMATMGSYGWIAPAEIVRARERLEEVGEKGNLVFESAARHKGGTVTPTEVSVRLVESESESMIISVIRDITKRKAEEEHLVYLAYHDSLTGLPNRAALEERLRTAIAESRRHKDLLALAYIDLDHFKPINDRYGHQIGDQALVTIARRMSGAVREQDHVSRIGGDEFVVVLPRLKSEVELAVLAQRLLEEIRQPIKSCGYECRLLASIGFAMFDAVDDTRSLIVKADIAMYAAKRDPDNPWLLWEPSMGTSLPG